MNDILINENIQYVCTRDVGFELDQSFSAAGHPDVLDLQDLPNHIAHGLLSLDYSEPFLGSGYSFGGIPMPHDTSSTTFVSLPDEIPSPLFSLDYLRTGGEVYNVLRDLQIKRDEQFYFPVLGISTITPPDMEVVRRSFADTFETPRFGEDSLSFPVLEFARGLGKVQPDDTAIAMAVRIVRAANDFTVGPHMTLDDEEGDLDFHLRLADGLLVMANLFPDGTIDASVYDDSNGVPVTVVKRMRRSTTTERDLIALFRAAVHASTT